MNMNPCGTLGADPEGVTMGQKLSTMFDLWKVSMTPGSPVAAELSKDPQMKSYIRSYRIGTGSLIALAFIGAVLMKRRKKKKAKLIQASLAMQK